MFNPEYIKIRNIGSIKEMDYYFKTNRSTIIQGKNLDDKGQKSNGVGKSSFLDSIAFSITGLSLRNISNEEMIFDGENEAYLEHSLKSNTEHLLIKRFLSRKKSQNIEVFINGVAKHKDESDVNDRNKLIIDLIGISKEDLFQFFILSKNRYKPYFSLSDTDQKAITSRFSNSNCIDNTKPLIEKDII
jgi:exonuclease SbcC